MFEETLPKLIPLQIWPKVTDFKQSGESFRIILSR